MDTAGGAEEQEEAKQRATDAQAVAQAAKAEAERLAREADAAIEAASRAAKAEAPAGPEGKLLGKAHHVAALAASTPIMASPPRVQRDTTGLGALASMAVSASPEAKKKRSE